MMIMVLILEGYLQYQEGHTGQIKCGFVGTKKQGQAYIFNDIEGLTELINVNIID